MQTCASWPKSGCLAVAGSAILSFSAILRNMKKDAMRIWVKIPISKDRKCLPYKRLKPQNTQAMLWTHILHNSSRVHIFYFFKKPLIWLQRWKYIFFMWHCLALFQLHVHVLLTCAAFCTPCDKGNSDSLFLGGYRVLTPSSPRRKTGQ